MPASTIVHAYEFECNNEALTPDKPPVNDIYTSDDILELLAAMNGERGYAEMLGAWSAWDALVKSADAATRTQMLEACRQFATARASALRNGAA